MRFALLPIVLLLFNCPIKAEGLDIFLDKKTDNGIKPIQILSLDSTNTCSHELWIDSDTTLVGLDHSYSLIVIKEGVSLTISYSLLNIDKGGTIYLSEGASLILDRTVISSCFDKWKGITMHKNAERIELLNYSIIKNADIGVKLAELPWLETMDASSFVSHPEFIMDFSGIKNCDIGVQFGAGTSNSEIRNDSWFNQNHTGVLYANHSKLVIDHSQFFENTEGIRIVDGHAWINDGNTFRDGEIGISVEGSAPNGAGVTIGQYGAGWNSFRGSLEDGIRGFGTDHPLVTSVVNCFFRDINNTAAAFKGESRYMYKNNTVVNAKNGITAIGSGKNLNLTLCNIFTDIGNVGIYYEGNNISSKFIENEFYGEQNINCHLQDAHINYSQGNGFESAGNCFSEKGIDISTSAQSEHFIYYYFNELINKPSCQEPMNEGNFTKDDASFPSEECAGLIGAFQLIHPIGNDTTGFDPYTVKKSDFDDHLSATEIINIIQELNAIVVHNGGDDIYTYAVENEMDTINTDVYVTDLQMNTLKRAELQMWLSYVFFRGMELRDQAFVENIVGPLLNWRCQSRLFGFKIATGDLEGAEELLEELPRNTTEEIAFYNIQQINIKRYRGGISNENITAQDLDYLQEISIQNTPNSGFAHSLYRILTGINLNYSIPDLNIDNDPLPRRNNPNNLASKISIFPNPFSSQIIVTLKDAEINNLEIIDNKGNTVYANFCNTAKIEINLPSLNAGLFLLRVTDKNGLSYTEKIIKK